MLIGYLRPHGGDEAGHAAGRRALAEAGCEQVVEEQPEADGHGKQPELHALLARFRVGDVVVVQQLDSLGPSPADLVHGVQRVAAAGAGLRSLTETVGATAAAVGGVPVQHDGQTAIQPAASRDPTAAPQGRTGGRPPKLSPEQRAEIAATVLSDRGSAADMARRYKVSEATISRVLAAARTDDASAPSARGRTEKEVDPAERIAGVLPFSALDGRLAVVGTSGSGKTFATKGLVERLHNRGRFPGDQTAVAA